MFTLCYISISGLLWGEIWRYSPIFFCQISHTFNQREISLLSSSKDIMVDYLSKNSV